MEYGEWRPQPGRLEVRIANPAQPSLGIRCDAVIDLAIGVPTVPSEIYQLLDLPGWGEIEFEGQSTAMSLKPSSDTAVHVSLGLLTALNLQVNRVTGELRSFVPFLHYPLIFDDTEGETS